MNQTQAALEEAIMNETQGIEREQTKGSKSFWNKFVTFLSMGGFIVILFLGVGIAILISYLTR
jgi:hypothetical protein